MTRTISILAVIAALAASAAAQMEKRDSELYEQERFRAADPAVGAVAPDLVLADCDGRLHALSSYRGRVVVVIKAGFT